MFDPRLLQAFVAIADAGSFTAAAQRLHSTQSTVSQQIGRLEEALRAPLFDRSARPVVLTSAGERLIGYARRILALQADAAALLADPAGSRTLRVGMPDDLVTPAMSRAFARFTATHGDTRLDVTSGLSRDLARRFRAGELDIALVKEPRPQADARASFPEALVWAEAARHLPPWGDPVPLVAFPAGGLYRDQMIAQIEAAGLRWYLAFTGNSLASVLHAVEAGLGISVLPAAVMGACDVQACHQFAPPAAMALAVYAWDEDTATSDLVAAMTQIVALGRAADPGVPAQL